MKLSNAPAWVFWLPVVSFLYIAWISARGKVPNGHEGVLSLFNGIYSGLQIVVAAYVINWWLTGSWR